MTRDQLLSILREQPLIVSAQASTSSPTDDTETLLRLAQASVAQGVRVLRLEGAERVSRIRRETGAIVIGLIKQSYPDLIPYITPTMAEIDALISTACEVIALDATANRVDLDEAIERIHTASALAMADCDSLEAAMAAQEAGADLVGTTLAGYTTSRAATAGPDLELLREIAAHVTIPVIAEGRYGERWQTEAALRIGAAAVVVGGAVNDPVKNTRALLHRSLPPGNIGAVDIGGTWLRFAVFTPGWEMISSERERLPQTKEEREAWIKARIASSNVCALGVSTGGTVDPRTGEVWSAKEYLMPNHIGSIFDQATYGIPARALDDGLATAWAHACLPQFAGRRVATLAIGTGVGCGFVVDGKIWMGPRGEYSHVNDMPIVHGKTCEEVLAGRVLGPDASEESKEVAEEALRIAIETIETMWFPDDIVVGGAVGLADWMQPAVRELGLHPSPIGADAGLYGAAALVLYPPENML